MSSLGECSGVSSYIFVMVGATLAPVELPFLAVILDLGEESAVSIWQVEDH